MYSKEIMDAAQYLARMSFRKKDVNGWVLAGEVLKWAYGLRGQIGVAEMEEIKDGNYTRS